MWMWWLKHYCIVCGGNNSQTYVAGAVLVKIGNGNGIGKEMPRSDYRDYRMQSRCQALAKQIRLGSVPYSQAFWSLSKTFSQAGLAAKT